MKKFDFNEYKTPFKANKYIIAPSEHEGDYNAQGVDCPFVFYHKGCWFLMHVGFDGRSYQTALSCSDTINGDYRFYDLILKRGDGNGWDSIGAAGCYILSEQDINRRRVLKKWKGKYWMLYHSYPFEGYEEGPASIGLAYCEDETLKDWKRLKEPILTSDKNIAWEAGGLYKEAIVEKDGLFYMFYNAKTASDDWNEQIGMATSEDLVHWTRCKNNPLLRNGNGYDAKFVSEPFILQNEDLYIMYYFVFNGKNARGGIGYSYDLRNWTKCDQLTLDIGDPGAIDDVHAHKSCVIEENGTLYHFYCAVGSNHIRGISYATNDRSKLSV